MRDGLVKTSVTTNIFSATMQDFWFFFFFGFLKIKNWHFLKDSDFFWHLAKISVTTVSFLLIRPVTCHRVCGLA